MYVKAMMLREPKPAEENPLPGRSLLLGKCGCAYGPAAYVTRTCISWRPKYPCSGCRLGAVRVGRAQDTPPGQLDSAITFSPAGWLVPEALRVLREGGTLAINAIHMSPLPEMPYAILYGDRTVHSMANATRRDAQELS